MTTARSRFFATPRASLTALALMAVVAPPGTALTEADGPDYWRIKDGIFGTLPVRAQPGDQSAITGALPADATNIRNLSCPGPGLADWTAMSDDERRHAADQRWCLIEYRGVEGYVRHRFLREDSSPPPSPN